jgi:uncharacterized membrane protein YhhN
MCATSWRPSVSLGAGAQRMLAVVVKQNQRVLVTAKTVADQIADDQRNLLAAPLAFRILGKILAFGGKTNA